MKRSTLGERGSIHPSTIIIIVLTLVSIGTAAFGGWAYLQYNEARTDVQGQIDVAVAEAKNEQAKEDEKKIQAAREQPFVQFVGPEDYGRVTFKYPRNWSAYEATDVSGGRGTYNAYLNPVVVPPVSGVNRFALRVTIEDRAYESVVQNYQKTVDRGDLQSRAFSADEQSGIRLDGQFDKNIRGAAVIFKIRDKTLTIRTDADTFKPYFDEIIKTIEFNR